MINAGKFSGNVFVHSFGTPQLLARANTLVLFMSALNASLGAVSRFCVQDGIGPETPITAVFLFSVSEKGAFRTLPCLRGFPVRELEL